LFPSAKGLFFYVRLCHPFLLGVDLPPLFPWFAFSIVCGFPSHHRIYFSVPHDLFLSFLQELTRGFASRIFLLLSVSSMIFCRSAYPRGSIAEFLFLCGPNCLFFFFLSLALKIFLLVQGSVLHFYSPVIPRAKSYSLSSSALHEELSAGCFAMSGRFIFF